jgi:hypothetical protein
MSSHIQIRVWRQQREKLENSPPKEPDIERVEERKFSKDEYSKNPTTLRAHFVSYIIVVCALQHIFHESKTSHCSMSSHFYESNSL